ncbi:methyltransferase domain-containing protein [Acidobacteria bacterium AH-259-D05]|nr:methyltransferase domain-containing protein [Acidobacteria bacterium AH-259-D05]
MSRFSATVEHPPAVDRSPGCGVAGKTYNLARTMPELNDRALKDRVAKFWDRNPCGSFSTNEQSGRYAFFEQVTHYRYATQPFMHKLIDFERFAGQRLLEVGCGLGTDLRQFALGGARVIGLDLSAGSVALARQHFLVLGTEGNFLRSDTEHLPFTAKSFDVVYSFGVLHHTPDTQAAIDECYRVLKPGGFFIAMFYNRCSWYVVVEPYLLAAKRWLLWQPLPANLTDPSEIVRRYDGAGNPLGKAYTPAKVRKMLQRFVHVHLHICYPLVVGGSRLVRSYSRFLEWSGINRRWGFWIVAQARRPASQRKME